MSDKRGVRYTKENEDYRHKIYHGSSGELILGWGHTLRPDEDVPKEVSQIFFKLDYKHAEEDYETLKLALDPVRRIVLIDLIFNMGLPKVLGFRKMLTALRKRDFGTAAAELEDSLYFKQAGHRAKRNRDILRDGIFIDCCIQNLNIAKRKNSDY